MLLAQLLLVFTCDGPGPVRFGVPLPAAALEHGLRASDGVRLQWRLLQARPDPRTGRQWVELSVVGADGRVEVWEGGPGAVVCGVGDLVAFDRSDEATDVAEVHTERWRWTSGETDVRQRTTYRETTELDGEVFAAGESWTDGGAALAERTTRVTIDPRWWAAAGVLPALGTLAKDEREHVAAAGRALETMPGRRGKGDYLRSHDVVTNLEFDTTLGFLRLGLALADRELLRRGLESARHLVDHDLHPRLGLPYRHGLDHRAVEPEVGHVWLQGVLLAGLLSGDDGLIAAARGIAHGLSRQPPSGQGENDRARDFGWPLLEMEAWLRFEDAPVIARAADGVAAALRLRFDAKASVLRFGEGERHGGVYEERAWITGGILVPALRAHLQRCPDPGLARVVAALEQRLARLVLQGGDGLPAWYWVQDGAIVGEAPVRSRPELYLLLEGLSRPQLRRALHRHVVRRALAGVPGDDDPDLPTSFSQAARCSWLLQ